MVKVNLDGRSRYSIKPIDEQLSFDKVRRVHRPLLTEILLNTPTLFHQSCQVPMDSYGCYNRSSILQGFFVFIRAMQSLTTRNQGVVVVSPQCTGLTCHVIEFLAGCQISLCSGE